MVKKIKLDFSKVEERSGWNTKEIPEGIHQMKVVDVSDQEAGDGNGEEEPEIPTPRHQAAAEGHRHGAEKEAPGCQREPAMTQVDPLNAMGKQDVQDSQPHEGNVTQTDQSPSV